MYVNRPKHEDALRRALKTGYNIVVYGDSGCGKSWLYKKIFDDENVYYDVVDFSSAENADDVDFQMLENVAAYQEWFETEKISEADAKFMPSGMGLGHKSQSTYARLDISPFNRLISAIRKKAKSRQAFLVFENLEYILDKPEVIKQIQLMLLALDDPNSGTFNVQVCLVGVPTEIKEVLSDGNKYQTISNRVYEIPEVTRLTRKSAELLIVRGLEQELDFTIESKTFCLSKIAFVTYQIPQYLHDVCLHIALRAEDGIKTINPDLIEEALEDWILSSSRQSIEFVRSWIMKDRSSNRAKSKIIYAISRLDKHFFSTDDINVELKRVFPNSMGKKRLQTLATLRRMTEGEERILKCDSERTLFRVSTPQLRSCLRICLKMDMQDEVITVKSFA